VADSLLRGGYRDFSTSVFMSELDRGGQHRTGGWIELDNTTYRRCPNCCNALSLFFKRHSNGYCTGFLK